MQGQQMPIPGAAHLSQQAGLFSRRNLHYRRSWHRRSSLMGCMISQPLMYQPVRFCANLLWFDLDGWGTTRCSRSLPPPAGQVPIIAFTAYAWGTEEQRARAAGCNAYLVKPVVDLRLLEQTVVGLLPAPPRP